MISLVKCRIYGGLWGDDCRVGALVTLDLPAGAPALTLPWIITFGPLAESVVNDQDLMAVVEPLQPYVSVERIRAEIVVARLVAEDEVAGVAEPDDYAGDRINAPEDSTPRVPPTADEVRAGFARIAAQLTADA